MFRFRSQCQGVALGLFIGLGIGIAAQGRSAPFQADKNEAGKDDPVVEITIPKGVLKGGVITADEWRSIERDGGERFTGTNAEVRSNSGIVIHSRNCQSAWNWNKATRDVHFVIRPTAPPAAH